ncbi:MAG: DUF3667 domain-containing protein [Bacteroidales bacterium]
MNYKKTNTSRNITDAFFMKWREQLKIRQQKTRRYLEYKRLKRVRRKNVPPYEKCKNCGETLHGCYCSKCGQYALDINQSWRCYLKQFLENTYQFDGKIVQTLRFLLFYPGFLSKEFLRGRINSYVLPLKLFMFLSLIFFSFVLLLLDRYDFPNNTELTKNDSITHVLRDIPAVLDSTVSTYKVDSPLIIAQNTDILPDFLKKDERFRTNPLSGRFSKREIQMIYHEIFLLITKYSPLILLLMIPLYGWMMKRAYRKKMPNYMHNLVFAFHVHCFFLILLSLGVLCSYYLNYNGWRWILLLFVFYHILAVHYFYSKNWVSAIYKSVLNLTLYAFLLFVIGAALFIYIVYRISVNYGLLDSLKPN